MKKLLWVGDAACDTGFARATHGVLDRLKDHWNVVVLGINYKGDPHEYPYPIYPSYPGGDLFGVGRVKDLAEREKVDLIVIQNDIWNIPPYLVKLEKKFPVVGVLPVDGKNSRGAMINELQLGIFWTKFGLCEARTGGYTSAATIIPLGIDLNTFQPLDKRLCRKNVLAPRFTNGQSPQDAFILGNVNRNQPRKRLDLTISYFAEWIKKYDVKDAYLLLHVAPTGNPTFDCRQLAMYYGITERVILSGYDRNYQEHALAQLYNVLDVGFTTTQGEGWGLTTMEGMACGVPQVVPEWAALGEWTKDAAELVPCSEIAVTPSRINAIGAVPDRAKMVVSLQALYDSKQRREELSESGLALVSQPQFSWQNIGDAFVSALEGV